MGMLLACSFPACGAAPPTPTDDYIVQQQAQALFLSCQPQQSCVRDKVTPMELRWERLHTQLPGADRLHLQAIRNEIRKMAVGTQSGADKQNMYAISDSEDDTLEEPLNG